MTLPLQMVASSVERRYNNKSTQNGQKYNTNIQRHIYGKMGHKTQIICSYVSL